MVLALRYLHKEKGILHRDLTPNNIMLGEDDKVTISKLFFSMLTAVIFLVTNSMCLYANFQLVTVIVIALPLLYGK